MRLSLSFGSVGPSKPTLLLLAPPSLFLIAAANPQACPPAGGWRGARRPHTHAAVLPCFRFFLFLWICWLAATARGSRYEEPDCTTYTNCAGDLIPPVFNPYLAVSKEVCVGDTRARLPGHQKANPTNLSFVRVCCHISSRQIRATQLTHGQLVVVVVMA